jgi:hypothetical protein
MTIEQLILIALVAIVVLMGVIAFILWGIYRKRSRSNPDHAITIQRHTDDKLTELDKWLEPVSSQAVHQTPAITAPAKSTTFDKVTVAPITVAAPVK